MTTEAVCLSGNALTLADGRTGAGVSAVTIELSDGYSSGGDAGAAAGKSSMTASGTVGSSD